MPVVKSDPATWQRALIRLRVLIRSQESWLLVALFLIGGALWLFAELADEVLEGDTHAFDRAVLLALRASTDPALPIGPQWLQSVARDITSLGSAAILVLVAVATTGFLLLIRKRGAAILISASLVGGALLSLALKVGFDRPRPDLVPHSVQAYFASFPSGHAMLATITYLTLGALLAQVQPQRRVKVYLLCWAVLISVLIGTSRVFLGVHWPTDVLAGWCVGAAWALVCASTALWLQRRSAIEHNTGP
jgi:undecaprenyl-diphosphatase